MGDLEQRSAWSKSPPDCSGEKVVWPAKGRQEDRPSKRPFQLSTQKAMVIWTSVIGRTGKKRLDSGYNKPKACYFM